MYFPNEIGKAYVVDCNVKPLEQVDQATPITVKFTYPGAGGSTTTTETTSDEGHLMLSYVAKTNGSTLVTMLTVNTTQFRFYGCELTKLN